MIHICQDECSVQFAFYEEKRYLINSIQIEVMYSDWSPVEEFHGWQIRFEVFVTPVKAKLHACYWAKNSLFCVGNLKCVLWEGNRIGNKISVDRFLTSCCNERVLIIYVQNYFLPYSLSLSWHLNRKTGEVIRMVDRGANSIYNLLKWVCNMNCFGLQCMKVLKHK